LRKMMRKAAGEILSDLGYSIRRRSIDADIHERCLPHPIQPATTHTYTHTHAIPALSSSPILSIVGASLTAAVWGNSL
jgi:hypothetical protein